MNLAISTFLIFSISLGQLIRIPFGSGAITLLDITVFTITALTLIKSKFILKNPPKFIKIALFFLLVSLTSLLLTPLHLTNYEFLLSFAYIVRFSIYVLFCYLLYSRILLNKNIDFILLSSGINISVLGFLQFIFFPNINFLVIDGWDPHYFRIVSTFLDPNFSGAFLVLTLVLLTNHSSKLLFLIIFMALLFTFSRGAYLMFLISFLTLSFLRRSLPLFILTLICCSILFLGFSVYHQEIAKPRNIDRAKSASLRQSTWQQGLEIFQKNPILGIGFNAYRYALREYNLAPEQFLQSRGSSFNDSSFLHVAATTGIIGFVSYFLFLFSLFEASRKNHIFISGLTGLIFMSFFANILFYPFFLIWIILAVSKFK